MSIIEHLIENYIHAMAQGKKPEEFADMYKDQLEDTGMSPENTWAIAQHVVYSLYDGFFPDFPDLPPSVRQVGRELREAVYCKDCKYFYAGVVDVATGEDEEVLEDVFSCTKLFDEYGYWLEVLPDDFCSWGVRKDDDTD